MTAAHPATTFQQQYLGPRHLKLRDNARQAERLTATRRKERQDGEAGLSWLEEHAIYSGRPSAGWGITEGV
jgi:hypothetical protein